MASAADRSTSPPKLPLWRRRSLRRVLVAVGALTLLGLTAVGVAALWAFTILPRSLPSVTALETLQPIQGTKIYDENDEPMTELHVERRILVPLAQIPQSLRDAILATEDRRFYSHWGIDPIGVARAVIQNYRRGRLVEGGSTITQQLTKVLFLTPDKSLERKLKEAVLALELERRYSKDRILEMYLNQVYFGHGSYGVEAAARTYFGKPVSELAVRESALIAGLPRAPSNYSPFDRGEAAKRRREVVLRRMVDYGALKGEDRSRLDPTGAEAHDRSILRRLRPADARGEVRSGSGPQGWSQRLYDAEPHHAARRRAVASRRAEGAPGSLDPSATRRVPRGSRGHGGAPDRLREDDGRRI
jgi:membrane peptidoglycan carboxypeptidase